jgi:hypothetical protein
MRVNRVTIEGRAFGWWQKGGERGVEIRPDKNQTGAQVDFSSTGCPFDRVLRPPGANPWLLNC